MSPSGSEVLTDEELEDIRQGIGLPNADLIFKRTVPALLATIDAMKVRAEIAESETERQRQRTRDAEHDRDELRASIGEWCSASELQVENVFALLKGYPRAVAVLRKAIR